MRVTRRSILSGIGLGTATLFARPLLQEAFAQSAGIPKFRMLVLCMPNVSIKARWAPTGGRNVPAGSGDATQFNWGFCNEPLEAVRPYVTLVDGLDHKAVGGDPHGSGFIRYTTGGSIVAGEGAKDPGAGRLPGDGNIAVMPSVDQLFIARSPIVGQKGLPIPGGLQLAIDTRGRTDGIHFITMSYIPDANGKMKPLPPENTPSKTYSRIMGLVAPGGANPQPGGGASAEQQANVMKELAKKRSVLDFIKNDLSRLQTRLGTQQRTKLESHLTGLREFENSLSAPVLDPTAGPAPDVKPPATIEAVAPNTNTNYVKLWDQYHDLAALAFQLDLTRTATILYGHGNNAWNGIHSTAHGGSADRLAGWTRDYMTMIAKFVQRVANRDDFGGTKLIDNTVITLSSDVSERHNHTNVPYLVMGGKNMGIKGGRVLRYPGLASNDVFSALAKPFQVELTNGKFGDPNWAKGPLPELVG
jgi:hypothetical protein